MTAPATELDADGDPCDRCAERPACDYDRLGLEDGEGAALTGLTSHMARALAHLRDAWCDAAAGNAEAIEEALAVLFARSHSMASQRRIMEHVLDAGHDGGAELVQRIRRREPGSVRP
ncbi:MAG: hypothetical protein AAB706_03385 [Patescibacteria group bacterium]